jgi:hypothetical protein
VASFLVATATATGISILSAGNPVTLFAGTTAPLADKSAPQRLWEEAALPPRSSPHSTDQFTSTIQSVVIQSTADAAALPPTAKAASTHEIAAASELASQTKTQNSEPSSSEALFRQFQAWAAEQDARAKLGRDAQKRKSATRTEIQNTQEPRARVRQQSARVQAQPVQEARAEQDDPVVSFLQSLNPFKAGPP